MPNNCSTLIQRKQNILHKILRSNSDGKLQNGKNIYKNMNLFKLRRNNLFVETID